MGRGAGGRQEHRRRQVGAPGAVDVPGFVLEARLRAAGGGAPA